MKKHEQLLNTIILNSDDINEAIQLLLEKKGIEFDDNICCWSLPENKTSFNKNTIDCDINYYTGVFFDNGKI